MTALHGNGKLLVLHVGTDVIDLNDPTREGGPSATDVEVSGFVHESMMPWLRTLWGDWWTVPQPHTGGCAEYKELTES